MFQFLLDWRVVLVFFINIIYPYQVCLILVYSHFHFHKSLFLYRSQASEDARRIVDEERTNARMEIENARAAVQRVQKVLQEKENNSQRIRKEVNCI